MKLRLVRSIWRSVEKGGKGSFGLSISRNLKGRRGRAEAVENAVKVARYFTKRTGVVVFENAYHGRTLLTMTMTSKVKPYKLGFGPFAPEVYRLPFGYEAAPGKLKDFFIQHVNPEAIACVVAEPVQGEGGQIAPFEPKANTAFKKLAFKTASHFVTGAEIFRQRAR